MQYSFSFPVESELKNGRGTNHVNRKRKKNCEYVFKVQGKSVKLGLGIVGIFTLVFVGALCIALAVSMDSAGRFAAIFTALPFLLVIFPVFIWKCKTYDFMYNDLVNGRYEVIRTTLEKKVIVRTVNSSRRGAFAAAKNKFSHIYFRCQGVDEDVFPLSMDLAPAAEEGVPITVVRFPSYRVSQGIVMSDDFDRKIYEWEQKM